MRPTEFTPPRWLANPHVQSLLATTRIRRALIDSAALRAASQWLTLDCGAGVRLLAAYAPQADADAATPVVVLIHGWEGSSESAYLVSAATALYACGAEVVRLNLRDHGETHHLNEELFHSCRLDEAVGAVAAVAARHPGRPLYLVGWSLGGNFAVRIAHRAPAAGVEIAHTFAVSPVIDPAKSYDAMQDGLLFYRHYFVRKWQRSLRRKQLAFPARYDFDEVLRMNDLRAMTAHLIERYAYADFDDVDAYFRGYALSREMLEGAARPLTVVTAADDPVIPYEDFAHLRSGGDFTLEVTRHGGHCGFMERVEAHSWVDRKLCRLVAA